MRGLSKAAALMLAPAVLARPVPTNPSLRDIPAESAFSVAIAVDTSASRDAKTTDQPLILNIDIQESPEACAPATVRIDGFLLAQDDTGAGQGTFASLDGHTVTASWNFTCREQQQQQQQQHPRGGGVPWDQDLAVTILSLDGEAAAPATASFATSFRQRAPVKVYDVGGDSVVYTAEGRAPSRVGQERILARIKGLTGVAEVDGQTRADVGEIVSLEGQMRELGERIRAKQRRVMERLGVSVAAPGLSMQAFYQTAKLASSTLRGTMEHWLGSALGFPVVRDDGRHGDEAGHRHHRHHHHRGGQHAHGDDGVVVSMQVDGKGGQRFFYYRDDADASSTRLTPSPAPRDVGYLPLLATIFTFHLALFFVLRSIRQRTSSRSNTHRHSSRSEEQSSTARLLRDSVGDLFRVRRIELDEKTRLRMMLEEGETSMEDELVSFREAAALFGDVVAAQGREEEDGGLPGYDEVEGVGEKRPGGC